MMNPVRFGWIDKVHDAVQESANDLLKENSLKRFMTKYNFKVSYASQREDEEFPGPAHFLDLEELWQDEIPDIVPQQGYHFNQIKKLFSSKNRAARVSQFRDTPLNYDTVSKLRHPNVVTSVIQNYEQMVEAMRSYKARLTQVPSVGELSLEEKRAWIKTLTDIAGKLSHYVGDLHNPMHNTYYDWKTPARFKKAHVTIDGILFNNQDYVDWQSQVAKESAEQGFEPTVMPLEDMKSRLVRAVELGYFLIYDIVQTDVETRRIARKGKGVSRPLYAEKIVEAWKPIAQDQMTTAAKLTASIFHSAFHEAGSPNLDVLM